TEVPRPDADERTAPNGRAAERRPDTIDGIPQEWVVGVRHRDGEEAARLEDAEELRQRGAVVQVLENFRREDLVERGGGERQPDGVRRGEARPRVPRPAYLRELEVEPDEARAPERAESAQMEAAAGAAVEDPFASGGRERLEEEPRATAVRHVGLVGE